MRHELKHRLNLFAGHVELLHHFLDAQIFQILEDRGYRHAGIAKNPSAAYFAGSAFNCGALAPIEN